MRLFEQTGKMALGSLLRFLGEKVTEDAAQIYRLYGIEMVPKWFPVFYVLSKSEGKTITEIAEEIGHSHASVSKIVAEMRRARVVVARAGSRDRRCTTVALSAAGREISKKIESQYTDVTAAIEELSSQATHDLWRALVEWEYLLRQKSLLARVSEKKKQRESRGVKIAPYEPKYRRAFRELNLNWIKTYFKVEKPDRDALNHPEEYILRRGGFIFVAIHGDKPVGVCALLKREDSLHPYELAKMAVSPEAQGKGIGLLLGNAVIEKARALKAARLYLESNTVMRPAISLYQKLGFQKIVGPPTAYARCDIQMCKIL